MRELTYNEAALEAVPRKVRFVGYCGCAEARAKWGADCSF
jgi:hypothetical protein